ncbi:glutathione S-transferase family protein [Parvularcula flava]|uniref:Glutathione S-transferase family protein n=1 Tax=Aquisalinus luteolus TaxID=1566827 RepID=A0A8J3A399_9PROT|nr:glutathione S-transferase C-terminal domain-containing protein [Aquisalinus luteolus]NHK28888.1 glutathione S-transferase family protein [Aquisalinus luteolus]GGH99819.1 thiol:disulfide oxidoreductase [Aquisalinus luteolus]
MIDLYTWSTPNGRKVSIMLEELGLDYDVHPVNILEDEQFAPDFLKISPNNKIPAIVDRNAPEGPRSVFESGAILIYLAEKTGSPLLAAEGPARTAAMEWLMFQMGGLGPMLGQLGHFTAFAPETVPYAIERYTREASRLIGVLDKRLGDNDYLAGDAYSIADIAVYPWIKSLDFYQEKAKEPITLPPAPNLDRWVDRIGTREAVQRGMAIPKV